MKIYTLGNHGFVTPSVIEALGQPRHIAQARVFIPAQSKAEAARLATSCGVTADARDSELRDTERQGFGLESMIAAGVIQPSAIYVIQLGGPHSPVLRLAPGGQMTVIGLLIGMFRADGVKREFFPLPDAGLPRPELSADEQKLIEGFGYADRWARWDAAQEEGGSR